MVSALVGWFLIGSLFGIRSALAWYFPLGHGYGNGLSDYTAAVDGEHFSHPSWAA
jgi:hypothetical protein